MKCLAAPASEDACADRMIDAGNDEQHSLLGWTRQGEQQDGAALAAWHMSLSRASLLCCCSAANEELMQSLDQARGPSPTAAWSGMITFLAKPGSVEVQLSLWT
jgi:hypothetical protein